jgi:hypothetical protein
VEKPIWYAILLAAITLAYWVVRELILHTFKNAREKKPYIICFGLIGFLIAVIFIVAGQFLHPAFGMLLPSQPYGLFQLILCPSALVGLAVMDFRHPPMSAVVVLGAVIAVMNSALYAAIGGRIGAAMLKAKGVRCS